MLKVGGVGALNTIQTNATTVVLTTLSAPFDAAGIAGYGVSSRIALRLRSRRWALSTPILFWHAPG